MAIDRLTRTGRTTRMLLDAAALSREGRAVYVVAASLQDASRLQIQFGDKDPNVKFETPETLGNLDWSQMRLRGAHPNCVMLVDHFAIESRFERLLAMLHRYDAP